MRTRCLLLAISAACLLAPGSAWGRGGAPILALDPDVGPAGATVHATGSGFQGTCGVRLHWGDDGLVVAHAQVGADGSFATDLLVPDVPAPGSYTVLAQGLHVDASGRCAEPGRTDPRTTTDFFVEPPPAPPVAEVTASSETVQPGGAFILDASGSSGGPPIAWNFDLNGNGSYETKCDQPAAAAVSNKKDNYTVGVQVVGADGSTDTAQVAIEVAGQPAPPPPKPGGGSYKPFVGGSQAGGCVEAGTNILEAQIKIYNCPTTVSVGVAEAVIPPDLPQDLCFERKNPGATLEHFVAKSKEVLLNGMRIDTLDDHLQLASKLKLVGVDGNTQKDSDAKFKVAQPGYATTIGTAPFYLYWKVDKPGVVGNVPIAQPFGLGRFLGLPYSTKTSSLKLTSDGGAEFQLYLELPFPKVLFKSLASSNSLTVRVNNTDGIQFQGGYTIKIPDVYVGLFTLKGTQVSYQHQGNSNVWTGTFGLEFPSSGVSADGQVVVADGVLQSLTAHYTPGPPGVGPIGCCVFIVDFDGALTDQYIQAGATFAAGPQVVGDARAADAHGTATIYYEPFEFLMAVDNVHVVTVPVNATSEVSVTLDSFSFKGGIDQGFGPFSFTGDVSANVGDGSWYAGGSGDGCVDVIIDACVGVTAGAGPSGVAGCGGITIIPGTWWTDPVKLSGGAVVYWPIGSGGFDVFKGCGTGKIKSKVGAKMAAKMLAQAGKRTGSLSFHVQDGLPLGLFAIKGEGDHPYVELTGPKGVDVISPAPGVGTVQGPGYFATTLTGDNTTYIAINHPPGGNWEVTPLEGSPQVESVGFAEGIPPKVVDGRITGHGSHRVLHYDASKIPGVTVTFVERGGPEVPDEPGESVDRVIGETSGGTGKLGFTPAEAKVRKRRIEAVVMTDGVAYDTQPVDSFKAPKFHRLPGPTVHARKQGNKLHVSWGKVGGAVSYRVIADVSDDPTRGFERKPGKRSLTLTGLTKHSKARIEVRAISEAGYLGQPGTKTFK